MASYTGSIADAGRLIHIAKRRERHKEDIEKQKQKIQAENAAVQKIGEKFQAHYDAIEQHLKTSTIGLVTLNQMKAKQEDMIKEREKQLSHKRLETELKAAKEAEELERKRKLQERETKCMLSFDIDELNGDDEDDDSDNNDDNNDDGECKATDEGQEEKPEEGCSVDDQVDEDSASSSNSSFPAVKKVKMTKDPTVDTSFLPDKEREEEENRLREQLRQEWTAQQERVKNETINIAFSYWDGSGHRRDFQMKKGNTIQQFLQKALEVLRKDFNELKASSADNLMFIKEDIIIPHFYTFYDFIVTKAMGKSGPLFEFDAAGELRIRSDAAVNSAESHPAKVVLRNWYERNKHIYPASRWEPFDPNKKYDTKRKKRGGDKKI